MPLRPPDPDDLAKAAQQYGLGLDEADVASFSPMVHGLLASWDAVEELYAASAPAMPERAWTRPEAADNPFNAWYVTTSITGSGEGPLAGKTVAVKDNTAVAGIPMMNGSRTIEGYTPRRDATIVTRLLGAGATIAGKSVCEDLCFSGGSHTARTGAGPQPLERGPLHRRLVVGQRGAGRLGRGRPRASAATRAARSGCRPPSAGSSGTSPPGASCPTPARSRSSRPSTTSARSRAPSPRRHWC